MDNYIHDTKAKSNSIHSNIYRFYTDPVRFGISSGTVTKRIIIIIHILSCYCLWGRLSSGPLQLILDRLCRVAALKAQGGVARTRTGIRYVRENNRLFVYLLVLRWTLLI